MLFGEEVGGARQGWANSIAADIVVRPRSPPGRRLSRIASSPTSGRVSTASSGCTSRPSPALSTRTRARTRAGSVRASRRATGAAGGVSDDVQRADAEDVEEGGDERGGVAAGCVGACGGHGFAVTGQAQRQHAVGPGEGGDHPPPARGALLVAVHQQQCRSGAGLQVLGGHTINGDTPVVDDDPARFLRRRLGLIRCRDDRPGASGCMRWSGGPDCITGVRGNTLTSRRSVGHATRRLTINNYSTRLGGLLQAAASGLSIAPPVDCGPVDVAGRGRALPARGCQRAVASDGRPGRCRRWVAWRVVALLSCLDRVSQGAG